MMDINILKEEISKTFELQKTAGRDAAAGIPAANAAALSEMENKVCNAAEQKGWNIARQISTHCEEVEQSTEECREVADAVSQSLQTGENVKPPDSGNLDSAERRRKNAETAYDRFKHDNGLTRDASGDDRLAQFFWALVVIAVESVMNGFFFREVATTGFAGGVFIALIISVINVGFAFLGGVMGLRYAINHCSPAIKLTGAGWFLLCFAVSMAIVMLSALFRGQLDAIDFAAIDNLQESVNQAWQESVNGFFAADFRAVFASLNSFSLALVGVLCAIFGAWKGYEYDDPYPGFGNMWRSREEATEQFREEREKYDENMGEWRNSHNRLLGTEDKKMRAAEEKLKIALGGMRESLLDDVAEKVAALAGLLLSEYRNANRIGRQEVPPYFEEYPKGDSFPKLQAEYRRLAQQAEALGEQGQRLLAECKSLRDKIRANKN